MRKSTSIETKCLECSKVFNVQPHRFKSGRGKFCSVTCRRLGIYTEEVRSKMSLKKKGIPRPQNAGDKCHFWKGGVTPINKAIRMSLEMKLWRETVFIRDGYTCQICKEKGGKLQADHIKSFARFPELRFAIDNGRTLCIDCHKNTDTYGWKSAEILEKI